MANSTEFEEPIKLELRELGTQTFKTATAVQEFAEAELETWSNVENALDDQHPFFGNPFPEILIRHAHRLRNFAEGYMNAPDSDAKRNSRERIENQLQAYTVDKGSFYPAKSPTSQRIASMAVINAPAAEILLARTFGYDVPVNAIERPLDFTQACIEADRPENDPSVDVQAYREALSGLRDEWDDQFRASQEQHAGIIAQFHREVEKLNEAHDQQVKQIGEVHAEHQVRMQQMESTFSTQMKLRSSERYWGEKRKVNVKRANERRWVLIAAVPFVIVALLAAFAGVNKVGIVPASGFSTVGVFAYGVPTIIALWMLRLVVREYRENIDLADDAEERVAMVYTFKALEYDDKVSDEERAIILQALFRPHGRAPEDTLPNPAWDAIVKRVERGGA